MVNCDKTKSNLELQIVFKWIWTENCRKNVPNFTASKNKKEIFFVQCKHQSKNFWIIFYSVNVSSQLFSFKWIVFMMQYASITGWKGTFVNIKKNLSHMRSSFSYESEELSLLSKLYFPFSLSLKQSKNFDVGSHKSSFYCFRIAQTLSSFLSGFTSAFISFLVFVVNAK